MKQLMEKFSEVNGNCSDSEKEVEKYRLICLSSTVRTLYECVINEIYRPVLKQLVEGVPQELFLGQMLHIDVYGV